TVGMERAAERITGFHRNGNRAVIVFDFHGSDGPIWHIVAPKLTVLTTTGSDDDGVWQVIDTLVLELYVDNPCTLGNTNNCIKASNAEVIYNVEVYDVTGICSDNGTLILK
ncbi:MAG: hypothetical protein GWO10_09095, partial [candidate division Zixibacteria bacterium]|nr:hypothetical protein [candidate division Zixibacteria bacterium]